MKYIDIVLCIELRLTGSKLGCGEEGCGACTVLIRRCLDRNSHDIEYRTVNGCLTPLCSIDGCQIITIEGLGSIKKSNLHPIQSRFAELFASQCGFCTPGVIMALYGNLTSKRDSPLTMHDIEDALDENSCRCTGYRPILDAAKTFACDTDKLPSIETTPLTSTTLDKCLTYSKQNCSSSTQTQLEFAEQLRDYIPSSIHIKGKISIHYQIRCIC